MDKDEITRALRSKRGQIPATEMMRYLCALVGKDLNQFAVIVCFKRAFPSIPLGVLSEASLWRGLGFGDLGDEAVEALLRPWLGPETGSGS